MSELNFMPAHQLAAMIRDRQVSAVDVLDAHLAPTSALLNLRDLRITLRKG